MTTAGSPPTTVGVIPYAQQYMVMPAPMDDWGYYEGLPTPPLSPLMPYNTVPWFYRRWMFDKIKKPMFGFALQRAISNSIDIPSYHNVISKTITNDPTFVTDYHLIAIRKQVEQLFAPFVRAYIILHVNDTMHHPPLYYITHERFQRSYWGALDENIGSIMNPGHKHVWRHGSPSGSLRLRQELTIAKQSETSSDGSIRGIIGTPQRLSNGTVVYSPSDTDFRSSYGNYYLLSVEPRWTITEIWRKLYLETWDDVQQDYQSTATDFQKIFWGGWNEIARLLTGFSPVGYAFAYALDYGAMWEDIAMIDQSDPDNWMPKRSYDPATGKSAYMGGPIYSAVTRPGREFGRNYVVGSERIAKAVRLDAIEFQGWHNVWGFNCGIIGKAPPEQQPPAVPQFPQTLERPHAEGGITYAYSTEVGANNFPARTGIVSFTYEAVGDEIEITPNEMTQGWVSDTGIPGEYTIHCLGAVAVPYYRITFMNFNGWVFSMDIRECEVYFG